MLGLDPHPFCCPRNPLKDTVRRRSDPVKFVDHVNNGAAGTSSFSENDSIRIHKMDRIGVSVCERFAKEQSRMLSFYEFASSKVVVQQP